MSFQKFNAPLPLALPFAAIILAMAVTTTAGLALSSTNAEARSCTKYDGWGCRIPGSPLAPKPDRPNIQKK